jgi:phenylalanyl-tRNA synthetase alpha chain
MSLPEELRAALESARAEGLALIGEARDLDALEEAKVRALGRKAPLARARAALKDAAQEDRRSLGMAANDVHAALATAIEDKRAEFAGAEQERRWEREAIDVTLPGDQVTVGALHPLTQTIARIVDIFVGLGYRVAEGPEIELSTYNFDALNTPVEHPSRSPQDTFYVEGRGTDVCLRPQTSPVQARVLEAHGPPVYVLAPGRCYRRDEPDPTHLSGFTQIEGLAVDENITMSDLKGTLAIVAHELFGRDLDIRLRPHFFPFTEPSAEMDVRCFVCGGSGCRVCKQEGWIEVLGCGVVDPALLEWAGIDPERYSGFAFGMGPERIASLAHGIADIRSLYENDLRLLSAFRGWV